MNHQAVGSTAAILMWARNGGGLPEQSPACRQATTLVLQAHAVDVSITGRGAC